jgi:hypothetical protein
MSVLSGAHMTLFPRVQALLEEAGAEGILLTGGGIIPEEDMAALEAQGTGKLFGPGTPTTAAIDYIRAWFADRRESPDGDRSHRKRTVGSDAFRRARGAPRALRQGGGKKRIEQAARAGEAHGPGAHRRCCSTRASRGSRSGMLVAHDLYDGQAPGAGVVTGSGASEGREVVVVANDATVKAGSWWPETIKKILRAQEIAMRCRIPIIYLVDSAGVNLPYQGGVFPGQYGAARIFYYNSVMRRYLRIPQLAAVMGPCIAGGAYLPALSDVILMVDGTSFMGLGGPNLVKGATGQSVAPRSSAGPACTPR